MGAPPLPECPSGRPAAGQDPHHLVRWFEQVLVRPYCKKKCLYTTQQEVGVVGCSLRKNNQWHVRGMERTQARQGRTRLSPPLTHSL